MGVRQLPGGARRRGDDRRPYNSFVLAGPDGTVHRYRKIHPFTYGGEDKHVRPGDELVTVEIGGLRVSPFVCYDLRFADEFWQRAAQTDVYLVPANWPASRRLHWQTLLQARAIENQAYVVGCNRVGDGRRARLLRRQPDRRPDRRAAGHCVAGRDDPARRRHRRPRARRPHPLPLHAGPPLNLFVVTHPEVTIDPSVPVPQWGLSTAGRERAAAVAAEPWVRRLAAVFASTERKAVETAELLAAVRAGRPHWRESFFYDIHSPDGTGDAIFFTMAHYPARAMLDSLQMGRAGGDAAPAGIQTRPYDGDPHTLVVGGARVDVVRPWQEIQLCSPTRRSARSAST